MNTQRAIHQHHAREHLRTCKAMGKPQHHELLIARIRQTQIRTQRLQAELNELRKDSTMNQDTTTKRRGFHDNEAHAEGDNFTLVTVVRRVYPYPHNIDSWCSKCGESATPHYTHSSVTRLLVQDGDYLMVTCTCGHQWYEHTKDHGEETK